MSSNQPPILPSVKELVQYLDTYVPEDPESNILIREEDIGAELRKRLKDDFFKHPNDFANNCLAHDWELHIFKIEGELYPWLVLLDMDRAHIVIHLDESTVIDVAFGIDELRQRERTFLGKIANRFLGFSPGSST